MSTLQNLPQILDHILQKRPDQAESEWQWLMGELGLRPEYFLAIREAIEQGRWRKAKNPKAYLKAVAKREARKMGLLETGGSGSAKEDELVLVGGGEIEGETATDEEMLDTLEYHQDSGEAVKGKDGVWRAGTGWTRDPEDPRSEHRTLRGFLLSGVPGEFTAEAGEPGEMEAVVEQINATTDEFHVHVEDFRELDWSKWAQAAGLDEWEMQAVEHKLNGVSRERALAAQPNEESRKALQAAWKRLERTGLERLRRAAGLEEE